MITMKRIIAFVLLGLLIYAGGFVIYYAAIDLKINNSVPADLESIRPNSVHTGLVAEGNVYQVLDEVYTDEHQPKLLGIPFGEAKVQHFYALPFGESDKFMLISASEQEDIEALERLKTDIPRIRGIDDPVLKVYGIMEETAPLDAKLFKDFLIIRYPELLGYSEYDFYRTEIAANNHVVPYTLYIKHPSGTDYIPLIVGIAMCAVGAGLAVLIILKIKSEREGY